MPFGEKERRDGNECGVLVRHAVGEVELRQRPRPDQGRRNGVREVDRRLRGRNQQEDGGDRGMSRITDCKQQGEENRRRRDRDGAEVEACRLRTDAVDDRLLQRGAVAEMGPQYWQAAIDEIVADVTAPLGASSGVCGAGRLARQDDRLLRHFPFGPAAPFRDLRHRAPVVVQRVVIHPVVRPGGIAREHGVDDIDLGEDAFPTCIGERPQTANQRRDFHASGRDRGDDPLDQGELQCRSGRPDLAEREIANFLGALQECDEAILVEAGVDVIEKRLGERADRGGRAPTNPGRRREGYARGRRGPGSPSPWRRSAVRSRRANCDAAGPPDEPRGPSRSHVAATGCAA